MGPFAIGKIDTPARTQLPSKKGMQAPKRPHEFDDDDDAYRNKQLDSTTRQMRLEKENASV